MKKINLFILCLFTFQFANSQKVDSEKTIEKINSAVKEFFISKGEIDSKNKLGIGAWEITDKTELGYKETGIYLIRTVYRTDGTDYLLLKKGEDFEIVDFKDLKNVIEKSIKLLNKKSEEELYFYMTKLLECYDGNYLAVKKLRITLRKEE